MSKKALKHDEVGYWSEIKLDIVKKYASAYSTILARQSFVKGHDYIDGYQFSHRVDRSYLEPRHGLRQGEPGMRPLLRRAHGEAAEGDGPK